jgi:cyclic pyranopterin phosphate synthase
MPATGVPKISHRDLMPLERLASMVRWLTLHAGIDRVRLTGGEPLVRQGVDRLIAILSSFSGIREISLTTNASLLESQALSLKAAGLKRVNISLDSLDKDAFAQITRGGNLERTLAGIEAAVAAGLTPIKLNTVLQRSSWKYEVPRLLDYAATKGFEVRFIELMQTGTERAWCESEYISVDEVCSLLGAKVTAVKDQSHVPARSTLLNWHGKLVNVGWIAPRSHPFCSHCERLRMDAQGRLRRCLMDPTMFDLPRTLETLNDTAAEWEFQSYIAGKVPPLSMNSSFAMSQIGG